MIYQDLVRDFAQRTRKNLNFIEEQVHSNPEIELYEVTQLINSLLGLLVFPREHYHRRDQKLEDFCYIPKTPLKTLENQGWPRVKVLAGQPPCRDLRTLIRHLRNSIAHFNIKFLADPITAQMAGVRLWNTSDGEETWGVELNLQELRLITELFLDVIEQKELTEFD